MKIECKPITKENEDALALPNDPFLEEGKVIPLYDGVNWNYRIEEFPKEKVTENCFPQEDYHLEELGKDYRAIAVYADGVCAGFALLKDDWNKWLYLDNLLVSGKYRGKGLGTALIEASMECAKNLNKIGVWLVCQDNNLQAMRFYLKKGFTIEGMNMPVYEGTKRAEMADLYLYKRLPKQ